MALGSPKSTTATLDTAYIGSAHPTPTNSANSSSSSDSGSGSAGGSNGLYLYTFLITLLVLLSVATLIIIRSCVLRRRFRRQMRLAIASGGRVPPGFPAVIAPQEGGIPIIIGVGRRRKPKVVLGEKPVLWEVYMANGTDETEFGIVKPMSTTVVRPTAASTPESNLQPTASPSTTTPPFILTPETAQEYFGIDVRSFREIAQDRLRTARSVLASRARRMNAANEAAHPLSQGTNPRARSNRQSDTGTPQSTDEELDEKELAVGFLIALPDARRPTHHPIGTFKVDLMGRRSPTDESIDYSPEELEKGKMKAVVLGDGHDAFAEDGELPPVLLGVLDVDWTGRNIPPTMKSQAGPEVTNDE